MCGELVRDYLERLMRVYRILYLFILLYPYLIWPWGSNVNTSFARSDWLALFTIAMWCWFLFIWYKEKYRPKLMTANWIFLIFVGLATLSTLFSDHLVFSWVGEYRRYEGLWAWYSYITLFLFAFLFTSPGNYRKIIVAFMIGGWVSSIYGIIQHFGLDFLPRAYFAVGWTRSFSFFGNPNFFGAYLVLVVVTGVVLYLLASNRRATIAWFVVTTTAFTALIYTETRGAWLGVGAALVVFTWFIGRRISWKRYTALLLVFICIFGLISLEGGRHLSRMTSWGDESRSIIEGEDGALAGRGYAWKRSLPLVGDYFWLGSGPDTFGLVFPQEGHLYWDKAHSEPLQIAITMGTPALLIYLAGLGIVFFKGLSVARKMNNMEEQVMLYGLLAACLGYQVHALINISTIGVVPFFWVLLGVAYKISVEGQLESGKLESGKGTVG